MQAADVQASHVVLEIRLECIKLQISLYRKSTRLITETDSIIFQIFATNFGFVILTLTQTYKQICLTQIHLKSYLLCLFFGEIMLIKSIHFVDARFMFKKN